MTPIDLGVSRSKVKVTVAYLTKSLYAQSLKNPFTHSLHIGMEVGHDQWMTAIDFGVSRSKVKVTGAYTTKSFSAQ